jgi:16S rRNA (guanine527-N7)-methyltransferase
MEINVNRFIDLLLAENQKQNLVSRKAEREDIQKHVQDSCALLKFKSLDGGKVIDIGSGAGFPGLILAIKSPAAWFTLVEADLKKSQFLQTVIESLNLKNVTVLRQRVEDLGRDLTHRESYDVCTSRAVAGMNILLEYSLPLIKINGVVAMWKGSSYQQEIAEAANSLSLLQGKILSLHTYSLMEEGERVIVMVGKDGNTPERYPRRSGVPAKRPL